MTTATLRAALVAVFLSSALASAARYDPDADRSALRLSAGSAHSAVVEAAGRALEPEGVPVITAGLDEGLRLARLAADAARSLDAAAKRRDAEMAAGVKPAALKLKETADAGAAERARWEKLSAEEEELKKKVDDIPEEEQKKIRPLLDKAAEALQAAGGELRTLEGNVKIMGERAAEMKAAHDEAMRPLVEISSAVAATVRRAEDMPAAIAEAKERLGALGQEPRSVARTRAWEKLDLLRGITGGLFEAADRACNRADDFRRRSNDYEGASGGFEKARSASGAGPVGAKAFLDEARRIQAQVRERLKKPAAP